VKECAGAGAGLAVLRGPTVSPAGVPQCVKAVAYAVRL